VATEKIVLHFEGDIGVIVPPSAPEISGWWPRYRDQLATKGLSSTAVQVIDLDSQYVINQGIFGAKDGANSFGGWPANRTRRGLVMGAVQSGKTASLIAVIAKALDRKIDIVVVLGGTRTALWRQTYERIVSQLDQWNDDADADRRMVRVLLPSPASLIAGDAGSGLASLYFETPNFVRRMLIEQKPLIAVVMKQVDHLEHFGRYLHKVLNSTFAKSDRPLHMLVIDDEADDGSILDSVAERGLSIDSDLLKQIPRHIQRLWTGHGTSSETISQNLFVSYVAYTATPQANFLQADHNPLSPTDFVAALRVPLDAGSIDPPREPTFKEACGLANFYTGGELFYRRLEGSGGAPCITKDFPVQDAHESSDDFEIRVEFEREDLLCDALRSYFVSGAIKLILSKRSLVRSRNAPPDTERNILALTPKPHSMLFHPSARIGTHFVAAEEIARWTQEYLTTVSVTIEGVFSEADLPLFSVEGLIARLGAEEEKWKIWLERFEETRHKLSFFPSGSLSEKVGVEHWDCVKKLLIEEVFPNTRLLVINSDPRADERPQFDCQHVGEGQYLAPRDIYTIFVSGNVMSRGITLEGLTTTLFLRSAEEPASDTQMQMQRWFGYRGSYLHLCRVFLFSDQYALFQAYHEADEALRREVLGEMNAHPSIAPKPMVLQGAGFRATGKIANLRALPLCPGADPFVRIIETSGFARHNTDILAGLLESDSWTEVIVGGSVRGISMGRQLSLIEAAELLERFRYSGHAPSPLGVNHQRWRALEAQNGLAFPEAPLFRPPGHIPGGAELVSPPNCPYSIAAYLRLWNALLTRRARGMIPTDDRNTPWSMIDLRDYANSAPKFYVGVRYGSAGLSTDIKLARRGVQRMDRSSSANVLVSTWGSRNPGQSPDAYLGDQLFDYHVHHRLPPSRRDGEPIWRKRGAPGLILFHVIRGQAGQDDVVTMGLALPLGGPDHIAALRPGN
jgi:hypothetical protein